jgi:hypothetical protein
MHVFMAPEPVEEAAPPRRPDAPPPVAEVADEPRPSPRRLREDYEEDQDEVRRPRRREEKPSKVQAIGIMVLIGGILACISALASTLFSGFLCCLWPGLYYGLVTGIMAIVKGTSLLNEKAYRLAPPQGIAIMMIINIINGDLVNLTLGILVLVFLSDKEVKDYFRG